LVDDIKIDKILNKSKKIKNFYINKFGILMLTNERQNDSLLYHPKKKNKDKIEEIVDSRNLQNENR